MVGINNLIGNVFILIFVEPIQAKNPLYHYIVFIYGGIMEFKINNDTWKILNKDCKTLLEELNSHSDRDDYYFAFGVTKYPTHEIWINKEMSREQQIKTLKHELTHCYIFNYGLYNVPSFNEEMVCDLVSSINDFINGVVEQYKKEKNNE